MTDRSGWRPLISLTLFMAGLYLTLRVAAEVIYRVEGYEPGTASCDDCGITILLDHIGWLALTTFCYFVVCGVVHVAVTRWREGG